MSDFLRAPSNEPLHTAADRHSHRSDFVELSQDLIRTRGNKYKLVQHHCHCDIRKFNFTNRVVPIWNSLPNHVVSADTVNTFKNRLDKFLLNQEVIFNYKADLTGTGNRSIIN